MSIFESRDLGPVDVFLGIRIIRNRQQRKIYLVQDTYVDKIVSKFNIEHFSMAKLPIQPKPLEPYSGIAKPESINLYQQKVGSVLYPSIISRPDIAYAASHLSQFLTNPGPDHHAAINQLIAYLRDTRISWNRIRWEPSSIRDSGISSLL